ncbi:hypothetical protein [Rhodopirellula sp. MGV]|nr:hypothetical protein [Rhodopirellula sp. MGV]
MSGKTQAQQGTDLANRGQQLPKNASDEMRRNYEQTRQANNGK